MPTKKKQSSKKAWWSRSIEIYRGKYGGSTKWNHEPKWIKKNVYSVIMIL